MRGLSGIIRFLGLAGLALLIALPALAVTSSISEHVVTYTSWTPDALYFAFRVDDPIAVGNQTLPLSQPWLDDAVAIYLNFRPNDRATLPTGDCLRIVISAAGGATVQRGDGGVWRDEPSWFQPSPDGMIRYCAKVMPPGIINDSSHPGKGYQVKLGLAWSLLQLQPPILMRAGGPLPTVGMALACYSQGETSSVSCWPPTLAPENLNNPSQWGHLQFLQELTPVTADGSLASASPTRYEPSIDDQPLGADWLTASVITFTKQTGAQATPVMPESHAVNLLATWYLLDPQEVGGVDQALEPSGPAAGPDSPIYHLTQIREARRAGIDAFAVVMPLDPKLREQTRWRLGALCAALQQYEHANTSQTLYDLPSVLPVFDLHGVEEDHDPQALTDALDDFYGIFPPQYRTMLPNAARQFCYPVVVTPAPTVPWASLAKAVDVSAIARWGAPVGWLLESGKDPGPPSTLARCHWEPTGGLQFGSGTIFPALLTPGSNAGTPTLPRRDGELYDTSWKRVDDSRPDFVLVRSWNDYANGTEIAASRQYGFQYLDSTKLATIQLGQGSFGVRLLRHSLPSRLRPGVTYPIELLIKNGSVAKLLTNSGYRVDYRLMRGTAELRHGIASEQLAILELSTARLRFNFTSELDNHVPLAPGDYQLYLDIHRNKLAFADIPMMSERLATIVLPFSVTAANDEQPQLQAREFPVHVCPGIDYPVSVSLRNVSKRDWRRNRITLRLQWLAADGQPLPDPVRISCPGTIHPGEEAAFTGTLRCATAGGGWCRLRADLEGVSDQPIPITTALIDVRETDLRAEFLQIGLPAEIDGTQNQIEAPIAVRNLGATTWTPQDTRICYQWQSWDGLPVHGAAGSAPVDGTTGTNQASTIRLPITLPEGAGALRCAFYLQYREQIVPLAGNPLGLVSPVLTTMLRPSKYLPISLKTAYNDWAAHTDSSSMMSKADLDGNGDAFPLQEFLPDASSPPLGYQPGYQQAAVNIAAPGFRFGQPEEGRAPMVRAKGQDVPLPGKPAAALHLVALNTGRENPVFFTVRYQDGTAQRIPLNISNWLDAPTFGEQIMLKSRHLHTSAGDEWHMQGSLFVYQLPLDPARTAVSVTLPDSPQICLFAMTLESPPAKPAQ